MSEQFQGRRALSQTSLAVSIWDIKGDSSTKGTQKPFLAYTFSSLISLVKASKDGFQLRTSSSGVQRLGGRWWFGFITCALLCWAADPEGPFILKFPEGHLPRNVAPVSWLLECVLALCTWKSHCPFGEMQVYTARWTFWRICKLWRGSRCELFAWPCRSAWLCTRPG